MSAAVGLTTLLYCLTLCRLRSASCPVAHQRLTQLSPVNTSNLGQSWINTNHRLSSHNEGEPVDEGKTPSNDDWLQSYTVNEAEHKDIPRYSEQPPAVLYAARGQPAIVRCAASPATLLFATCVTDHIASSRLLPITRISKEVEHSLDVPVLGNSSRLVNGTASRRTRSSVKNRYQLITQLPKNGLLVVREVTARTVEDWFGDFWCRCEAWNNMPELGEPRLSLSRKTYVRVAYLKKRFVKQPSSTRIPLGWPAEFICQPPHGMPTPKVYWLKNGQPINTSFDSETKEPGEHYQVMTSKSTKTTTTTKEDLTRVRQEDERDVIREDSVTVFSRLTIEKSQLSDEGAYICVTENQAGRKTSLPARLTIHVDGNWSPWSSWSPCPQICLPGTSERENQSLVGKGTESGFPVESAVTHNQSLSADCPPVCRLSKTQRRRTCNSPRPHGGGRDCSGVPVEQFTCLTLCNSEVNRTRQVTRTELADQGSDFTSTDVVLVVLLVFSIVFFLVAAFGVFHVFVHNRLDKKVHFTQTGRNVPAVRPELFNRTDGQLSGDSEPLAAAVVKPPAFHLTANAADNNCIEMTQSTVLKSPSNVVKQSKRLSDCTMEVVPNTRLPPDYLRGGMSISSHCRQKRSTSPSSYFVDGRIRRHFEERSCRTPRPFVMVSQLPSHSHRPNFVSCDSKGERRSMHTSNTDTGMH